jgi:hypothetical protein
VSPAAAALIGAVRAYQVLLAPLVGGACRFHPSCSHYMVEAVTRHGALRGGWLGLRRVARCHPFGGQGFDPVPDDSRGRPRDTRPAAPAEDDSSPSPSSEAGSKRR